MTARISLIAVKSAAVIERVNKLMKCVNQAIFPSSRRRGIPPIPTNSFTAS